MWEEILDKDAYMFILKEAEDDQISISKFFELMSTKSVSTYDEMISKAESWEEMEVMEQIRFATGIVDEMNISRFLALMDYLAKSRRK